MTNMTAVIIPDTVTIKPHVSFNKLKPQSSVQMYCNKKSRSRAAWGCISSCLVSTSSQQPSHLKWCITPLYEPVCLFILNEFHHLQSLIFQIHCCTAVKWLSITTPGLESGRVNSAIYKSHCLFPRDTQFPLKNHFKIFYWQFGSMD